jgi:AraC-like DNA-binding protein
VAGIRYVEQHPRQELRPHVECLWLAADPRPRARREPERVVPDGCPELIVHLGDPWARLRDGRFRVQPRAFLAGTLTRPWLLRAGRRVLTLGIRFRPGQVRALLPVSMRAAVDRETSLSALVGAHPAAALVRELRAASSDGGRFAAAGAWLAALPGRSAARASAADQGVAAVLAARGAVRIDELALRLGATRRAVERAFTRELGISPKLFARIVRLNAVLAGLDAAERASAVDMALAAGYFDQAHLLRDFRGLAGRTPRAGRDRDGELARHFTHPERLRLLLAGD